MVVQQRRPPAIRVKAPYPGFIEPALATAIDKVLKGDRWIHEIKFDGYRVQLYLANEKIKVFSLSVLQNELMGKFKKYRDGCLRPALSQRLPPSKTATGGAKI
jgi:bifunctional non-homologous end joining protein LigD